jgi:hypothetical protein
MIGVLFAVVILNSSSRHRHFAAAATQLQILWMLQNQVDSFLHRSLHVFVTAKKELFPYCSWIRKWLQSKRTVLYFSNNLNYCYFLKTTCLYFARSKLHRNSQKNRTVCYQFCNQSNNPSYQFSWLFFNNNRLLSIRAGYLIITL